MAAAVASVIPLADLAYIGYAHCEGDECGAMNLLLEAVSAAAGGGMSSSNKLTNVERN